MASSSSTRYSEMVQAVLLQTTKDPLFTSELPRAKEAAQYLHEISFSEKKFNDIATAIVTAIEEIVIDVRGKSYKSFKTTKERLWLSFHKIRDQDLRKLWDMMIAEMKLVENGHGAGVNDPILLQHFNIKLFEAVLKDKIPQLISMSLYHSLVQMKKMH